VRAVEPDDQAIQLVAGHQLEELLSGDRRQPASERSAEAVVNPSKPAAGVR
jgi:hypothetical protein